jgi:hypothetical protein
MSGYHWRYSNAEPFKNHFKEESPMDDLNKASEPLATLKHVRIVYLPPCKVAASYFFGESPEDHAEKPLAEFIRGIKLPKDKPDIRVFGFNNPSPAGSETYGYEFWVSIPEEMDVPQPRCRKSILAEACMQLTASRWVIFKSGSYSAIGQRIMANMCMMHGSRSV